MKNLDLLDANKYFICKRDCPQNIKMIKEYLKRGTFLIDICEDENNIICYIFEK